MKLDVRTNSPEEIAKPWLITLDGVKQEWCVAADEEAGTVTRYVLDAKGICLIDPSDGESLLTETMHGKVIITLKNDS